MTASEQLSHVRATRFEDWRHTARRLLISGAAPETIAWTDGRSKTSQEQTDLFGNEFSVLPESPPENKDSSPSPFRVPPAFVETARKVACHRSPRRWEFLYRLLWRITGGEKNLLSNATDRDVYEVTAFQKAIQRDSHKMKAFVRFRKTTDDAGERYVAVRRESCCVTKTDFAKWTMATYHPSALLRVPDESAREKMRVSFTEDLRYAADHLKMINETAAGE